ncbi:GNAT family acetyltransferase [Klebsiella michiganensis]|uniref:GNAT family acetyltransferase n=1 Tax=Klebsiella michiganensis TaxID=1134687 RepID=A0A7H4PJN9_9ENTR|nr:GNAT family acetyltransferase [Klebsiella michiganensis]
MTHHFRRLTLDDKHDYLALMLAAYAPIKALGIQFDAATADLARVNATSRRSCGVCAV